MNRIIAFCKWCQNLPLPDLATHLKETGVDGVDLPCRPGAAIEPEDAAKMLPEAKKVFEDHGLMLDRLVTGIREADDVSDRQLEAIRNVGIEKIRLGGYPVGDLPAPMCPHPKLGCSRDGRIDDRRCGWSIA